MILESVTILYYTLATISIGIVLYQKYNTKIHSFINKWLYNYESVPNEDIDLCSINDSNNDNTYILFNENNNQNNNQNINQINDNQINDNQINNNQINDNQINDNQNKNQEIKVLKTKKNIVIDFE